MTCGRSTIAREPTVTEPRGPWGNLLTLDVNTPIEIGGLRVTIDRIANLEWIGAILRDNIAPIEFTGGVILSLDGSDPIEFQAGVALDVKAPLETLHGVLLNLDGPVPLAFTVQLAIDFYDPIEITGTPSLIGDVLRPATPVFVLVPQRPRGN